MSTDDRDLFSLSGDRNEDARAEIRDRAAGDFDEAAKLATAHGLLLKKCTPTHYQLIGGGGAGWLTNLYPTTGTVQRDAKRPCNPMPDLPRGWTLIEAIRAAIKVA